MEALSTAIHSSTNWGLKRLLTSLISKLALEARLSLCFCLNWSKQNETIITYAKHVMS